MKQPLQLSFCFHKLSTMQEEMSLNWWASRITDAEIMTGNKDAINNPSYYMGKIKDRFEGLIERVHEEWLRAAQEGTLNQPIWPKAPVHIMPKRNVITLGAAS